jgi:hypothetical protein
MTAAPAPKADEKAPAQSGAFTDHRSSLANKGAEAPPAPTSPSAVWDADSDADPLFTDPGALWQHVLFVFEAEPSSEVPAAPADPSQPSATPPAAPSEP